MKNTTFKMKYAVAPAVLALAAILAACGGSPTKVSASPTTTVANRSGLGGSGRGGPRGPAASGQVASITGSSMEVQSQASGQETVSWTSSTRFVDTATAPSSALAAGDCVTVTGTRSGSTLTARSVEITTASSKGSCTAGAFGGARGFGGGFARSGSGGGAASGSRPTFPANGGSLPAVAANLGFATGKVTAVSGPALTIDGYSINPGSFRPRSGSTSSSTTVPATTTIRVVLTSSTAYMERSEGSAANLAVGDCVTAQGSTDSTGAVSATSVSITPAVNGICSSFGFGRGGGGASGGGGTAGSGAAQ
ncbi:MAG: DUF5666 domain-containing protein [Acidimicrobiales bacterium]